jgi:hypothetical protein
MNSTTKGRSPAEYAVSVPTSPGGELSRGRSGHPAFAVRILATAVDWLVIWNFIFIVDILTPVGELIRWAGFPYSLAAVLMIGLYYFLSFGLAGGSPGKVFFSLTTIRVKDGRPATWLRLMARELVKLLFAGGAMMALVGMAKPPLNLAIPVAVLLALVLAEMLQSYRGDGRQVHDILSGTEILRGRRPSLGRLWLRRFRPRPKP